MKRALLVLAAALTACGGASKIDPTAARNALPTSSSVQIASPGQSATATTGSNTALQTALATSGTVSDAFKLTAGTAATVNVGVGLWIGLLEFVVALPPTSCTVDTCTWGPWKETNPLKVPASYQLTVTKEGDSRYSYKVSGALASSPTSFIDIVVGSVTTNGVPHHGAGSFTVDFDAGGAFDPTSNDTGKLVVTHSNVAGLQIGMTLTGGTEHNGAHVGETLDAAYAFDQNATSGDLQVALHYVTSGTQFTLHSRWDGTGAGRCDISSQAPTAAQWSECWGPSTDSPPFDLVYNSVNAVYSDPSACVFQTAAYATLTAP